MKMFRCGSLDELKLIQSNPGLPAEDNVLLQLILDPSKVPSTDPPKHDHNNPNHVLIDKAI